MKWLRACAPVDPMSSKALAPSQLALTHFVGCRPSYPYGDGLYDSTSNLALAGHRAPNSLTSFHLLTLILPLSPQELVPHRTAPSALISPTHGHHFCNHPFRHLRDIHIHIHLHTHIHTHTHKKPQSPVRYLPSTAAGTAAVQNQNRPKAKVKSEAWVSRR